MGEWEDEMRLEQDIDEYGRILNKSAIEYYQDVLKPEDLDKGKGRLLEMMWKYDFITPVVRDMVSELQGKYPNLNVDNSIEYKLHADAEAAVINAFGL